MDFFCYVIHPTKERGRLTYQASTLVREEAFFRSKRLQDVLSRQHYGALDATKPAILDPLFAPHPLGRAPTDLLANRLLLNGLSTCAMTTASSHREVFDLGSTAAIHVAILSDALIPNPATGKVSKSVEHNNEFGVNLSGPLVPVGSWKEKLFFFGNYNIFRYSSATPTPITLPTPAQQAGNFTAAGISICDPNTQAACTFKEH